METKVLIEYDLKRVISFFSKEFGTITKGSEEDYNPQLHSLEYAIYEIYTKYQISDISLQRVISMVLYDVKSKIDDRLYDYQNISTKEERNFAKELEKLFCYFENEDIKNSLINIDLNNKEDLKKLFTFPVKCLLRIYDSISFWHERYGNNGYYKMLEEYVIKFQVLNEHPYILENIYVTPCDSNISLINHIDNNLEQIS